MDDMQEAPAWALIGWGAVWLLPALILGLGDVMAGAAVRYACAALRAARGE